MRKRKIVITTGDPAGVGPEIILQTMNDKKTASLANYIVFGNEAIMRRTAENLDINFPFKVCDKNDLKFTSTPKLIETDKLKGAAIVPGKWSVPTGRASLSYILMATHMCKEGLADAIVTGPICKEAITKAGCKYPGHTEFIADLTGSEKVVMMLTGGGLRVALVTTHVAIATLPQLVTRGEVYATIEVTYKEMQKSFGIKKPRIAILGLNPHAGENGMLGNEEKRHIIPAMKEASKRKMPTLGPIPSDTAFHRMLKGEFDAIIAMYHDQGLGPLKTVAFDDGVNITLGMPIIRTSVDHGTAFDIAGKGIAKPDSLKEAIKTAIDMAHHRAKYGEKK